MPLDSRTVLGKVAALPLTEWNYRDDPAMIRHVGPMSQDFHAAFQLNGSDDKHISVVDESGVALAAIQGLNRELEARTQTLEQELKHRDAEDAKLKARVSDLKAQLDGLQEVVARLAHTSTGRFTLNSQQQEAK